MSRLQKISSIMHNLRCWETSFTVGAAALVAAAITSTFVDAAVGYAGGQPLPLSAYFAVMGGNVCFLGLLIGGFVLIDRVLSVGLKRLHRPGAKPYLIGICFAAAVVPLFYRLAETIVSGEWIAQQKFAWAIFLAPAVFGPLFIGVAVILYLRFIEKIPLGGGRVMQLIAALLILSTMLFYAVLCLLPFRFNPLLSIILWGLSLVGTFACYLRVFRAIRQPTGPQIRIAVNFFLVLAALTSSVSALMMSRSTRSEIVTKSVTMGEVFRKTGAIGSESLLLETLKQLDMSQGMAGPAEDLPRGLIQGKQDWNVMLLVVDGLRADTLWPNRKKGQVHAKNGDTPFLDKWMKGAYVFRRAYAQGSRTHRSMPALFRSLEPFEDADHIGVPLGTYMHSLGRDNIAAVPTLFTQSFRKTFQNLLIDFDEIHHQEIQNQDKQVPEFLKAVRSRKSTRPLFSWIHFYYMHSPGYVGRFLTKADGGKKEGYRKSLQYLDTQIKMLMDGLKSAGIDKKTIFIFTADHGENLGDNKDLTHGFTVYEEAIRVPLFIKIPGLPGTVIENTVGNIDILPTITDLLGQPAVPTHQGHSLVPLIMDPTIPWERDYFTKNAVGEMISMVRGQDKIIQDIEADTIYRYNLKTDPKENKNLFDMKGELDRSLLLSILRASPDRFATQLKTSEIQELLVSRIQELDEDSSKDVLSFLLKLSNADPSRRAQQAVLDLFHRSSDQNITLAVLKNCFSENTKVYSTLLEQYIKNLKNAVREQRFIDSLFHQNQPEFSDSFAALKMQKHAKERRFGNLRAWLRLTGNWEKKPIKKYASAFYAILQQAPSFRGKNADLLQLTLEDIGASYRRRGARIDHNLVTLVEKSVTDTDPAVREAALKALGTVGDSNSVNVMMQMMDSSLQSFKIQQAFLNSVGLIQGEDAIPILTRYSANLDLQVDILRILQTINSPKGIPLLQVIADNYPASFFRSMAKRTIDNLNKKPTRK
jgi:hypothetical protein